MVKLNKNKAHNHKCKILMRRKKMKPNIKRKKATNEFFQEPKYFIISRELREKKTQRQKEL